MEYTSKEQLYNELKPVFKVKRRLMSYSKNNHITDEDIWLYLIETKWKKSHDLTLAEIINDIINVDESLIN